LIVAEYGTNPNIYLYNTSLELLHTFKGIDNSDLDICELDIEDMIISFRGERALIVTGCTEYAFKLLDLEKNEVYSLVILTHLARMLKRIKFQKIT